MWHSPGVHSWEVTRERRGRADVTLRVGPRILAGRVTRAELDRIAPVLDAAVEAGRRGDYSRIRLGAGLREAIGRDPLRSPGRDGRRLLLPVWVAAAYLVLGAGFGLRQHAWWLQALGWSVAAVAVADLGRRAVSACRERALRP